MHGPKLFLAHFTFRSGEAEMPFHHTVFATDMDEAEKKLEAYLADFGPSPKLIGYLSYLYDRGYYAVVYEALDETLPEGVVRHLLIHGGTA